MTLYQIEQNYIEALDSCIDMETGEILDAERFEEVQAQYCADRNAKIENIMCYIKNLKSMSSAIREEEKALASRRKAMENKADRLVDYLGIVLNGEKFESSKGSISYRKSESVEVDIEKFKNNESWTEYAKYKEPEINKTELKKAIKEGNVFEGAEIISKLNMQIK